MASGGTPARELVDLLGKPLGAAEKDKALSIVRSNGGLDAAHQMARTFVTAAERACDRMPNSAATEALRATPSALLASLV
jgi:geranylgeranyl pyrophosphate synthase